MVDRAPGAPSVLSVVGPELRTSASALAVGVERLVDQVEELDPVQLRAEVSGIRRGVLNLQELVENVLGTARLRTGRFEVQRRLVCPRDLVAEVPPRVAPLLHEREQVLRIRIRGAVPRVFADAQRIAQVLVNLISNASQYGPRGQPIELTLSPRAAAVRITVGDRGPGLPAGRPQQLFEPFRRGEAAGRAGAASRGLEFAVVRAIVEAHGGRIGARNRRGGGAAFWLELPVADEPRSEP